MLDTPPLLLFGVSLAMACGMYVFFVLCRTRRWQRILMWWGGATAIVCGIAILAFSIDLQARAALFFGLILPMWAFGGFFGAVAGLIWYRKG